MLYQPQSALTGLAITNHEGEPYVLVQARIEPGNTGIGQYGPTIQSTPANFMKWHGGKQTPWLDIFFTSNREWRQLGTSMQLDLGERYYQKCKWHNYIELNNMPDSGSHMIWASIRALIHSAQTDHFLNADLRCLLSVFDWEGYINPGKSSSLIDPVIFGTLLNSQHSNGFQWRNVPIEALKRWEITESGITDKKEKLAVNMYHTRSVTREVSEWFQPLMTSPDRGLVLLLCRASYDGYEYLLSVQDEPGIPGESHITTTHVFYPGDDVPTELIELGTPRFAFTQSDEGGRFYSHQSLYRVCEVDADHSINENQTWVNIAVLKKILAMSNVASFQLRAICASLLLELNPSLH